ncbi:MAG: sulfatase-like hydrolase/transferase, partial [Deltaproteobacteria bacterium]|nr:sulfatase-like hydrolase/transferase [Deltaproteobacteria bacterium]
MIFVTSVAFPGCRRKRLPGAPKNVILLVLDTTRADHVAPIGKRARTPNLRRMAREGTTFTRAYSHIPITGPSHSSMFTSLYPREHGVLNNGQNLSGSHSTLAEIMRDAGYHTVAFMSLMTLDRRYGFNQGFAEYHDRFGHDWWKRADAINGQILPWLRNNRDRP